jgi:hypothetical protein
MQSISATCSDYGFYDGNVGCVNCQLDPSSCSGLCGDGIINGGEFCDTTNPAGTCGAWGFQRGNPECSSDCDLAGCGIIGWQPQTLTSTATNSISGLGPRDLFGVGASGSLLHYRGGSWVPLETGTTANLRSVWASSEGPLFAAGDDGVIVFHDRQDPTLHSFGSEPLFDVWGRSPSDVYVVGAAGTIGHYDGTTWSAVDTGLSVTQDLVAIDGNESGSLAVVGTGTLIIFDGSSWKQFDDAALVGKVLQDVRLWGDQGITVGDGSAIRFDSTVVLEDKAVSKDLKTLGGPSINNVYAFGELPGGLHYDGTSWRHVEIPTQHGRFRAVWSHGKDVLALSGSGVLYRSEGSHYSYADTDPIQHVRYDVAWGTSATSAWFGSRDFGGGIFHYDGRTLTRRVNAFIFDIWGTGPNNMYAAGLLSAWRNTGSGWVNISRNLNPMSPGTVFGSADNDVWFGGWQGALQHWDGNTWHFHASKTEETFWCGWSASETLAFAAGEEGVIRRWDGTSWSTMESGTGEWLEHMWGSGPDSVYVGSTSGTLLRFDGTAWNLEHTFPAISQIWGSGPDDVFVSTGYGGQLWHFDGAEWGEIRAVPLVPFSVWGSGSKLFVAGLNPFNNYSRVQTLSRITKWNCAESEVDCGNAVDDDCDGAVDESDSDCL